MYPSLSAHTSVIVSDIFNLSVLYTASGSPPWALTNSAILSKALPSLITLSNSFLTVSLSRSSLAASTIYVPRLRTSLVKSSGPSPFKVLIASITSSALPTAYPNGWSISVISAVTFLPAPFPIRTISLARLTASASFFINAPLPVLTSRTIASAPEASFLLIILLAISEIFSTVAVTSLSAYIFLSAGARLPVWPVIAIPISLTCLTNASSDKEVLNPGILSSLSIVPPVCPSPLPLIFATLPPSAATIGARTSEVLSPTPPVLCLSTLIPLIPDKSSLSPLFSIASVRLRVSS